MVKTWKQIKTKTQRQNLIDRTVRALERLVSSKEVKDLIDDVPITKMEAEMEETDGAHERNLYLNKRGLMESQHCHGHRYIDMADIAERTPCEDGDIEPRKVPERKFRGVVISYQLTPHRISKVHASLRA
jgi:hypothetical protein